MRRFSGRTRVTSLGNFFGSRTRFHRALPWLLAAALVLGTALPLSSRQTKPCVAGDERAECAAPADVKTVDTGRASPPAETAPSPLHDEKPAEPALEFESYVEGSLGHPLPLFGRSLFAHAPSTFAPVNDAPVPADYVVGPGDELVVRGWGQVEIEARVTVDRGGQIFLPKVGMISVAGVHYGDLHDHLQAAVQRVFRNFELSVSLGQLRTIQIFVVGRAREPGRYTVSSLRTLVNVLFACGGPSARGS